MILPLLSKDLIRQSVSWAFQNLLNSGMVMREQVGPGLYKEPHNPFNSQQAYGQDAALFALIEVFVTEINATRSAMHEQVDLETMDLEQLRILTEHAMGVLDRRLKEAKK